MRAIWTGALSFGLVNIPVRLYSATDEAGIKFHYLHEKDSSPVRYARICRTEEREIPFEEIVRGYEYEKGRYVVISDEDFERANPRKTGTIEILDFVSEKEIDPIYFEKPYYLEPDRRADRSYALLREALERSGRVGVARFVIRNRERIGAVKPREGVIVLEQLRYAADLRPASSLRTPEAEVEEREVGMALALIDQLTEPFRPEQYRDTYREELERVIEEKVAGRAPAPAGEAPEPTEVRDLMAALRASLEERKPAEAFGERIEDRRRKRK